MKFRALNFCIMLILFNLSLTILSAANVVINPEVEPVYPTSNNSTVVESHTSGVIGKIVSIISKPLHFAGLVDENGNPTENAALSMVLLAIGVLSLVAIKITYLQPVGLNVVLFGIIFWTTTVASMGSINSMLKTLGWDYMIVPIYVIFAIFYVIGAMELAGGGFGANE